MKARGRSMIKLMNLKKEIEYCIHHRRLEPGESAIIDNKSVMHTMKIIYDDAQTYLSKGHRIKIQNNNPDQYNKYMDLAQHMIDKSGLDKKVSELGEEKGIDGNSYHTLAIEGTRYERVPTIIENILLD